MGTDDIAVLVVRRAAVEELDLEPRVLVAAVAEQPDGTGFTLEFQLGASFDEQDRELGMDTYCICTSEGPTHYGGVARFAVEDDGVLLELDPDAARVLQVPERFRIRLEVDEHDKAAFCDGLRRVLEGRGYSSVGEYS